MSSASRAAAFCVNSVNKLASKHLPATHACCAQRHRQHPHFHCKIRPRHLFVLRVCVCVCANACGRTYRSSAASYSALAASRFCSLPGTRSRFSLHCGRSLHLAASLSLARSLALSLTRYLTRYLGLSLFRSLSIARSLARSLALPRAREITYALKERDTHRDTCRPPHRHGT